jgi:hypothetical protein
LDDLYVFDTVTLTWRKGKFVFGILLPLLQMITFNLTEESRNNPEARCGHRLVVVGENIYMFGGGAGNNIEYYRFIWFTKTSCCNR